MVTATNHKSKVTVDRVCCSNFVRGVLQRLLYNNQAIQNPVQPCLRSKSVLRVTAVGDTVD